MAKNTVEITLRLKNRLGKAYAQVANGVKGQNKQIQNSFNRMSTSTRSSIDRLKKSMGGMNTGLGGIIKRFGPLLAGVVGVTVAFRALGKGIAFVTEKSRAFEASLSKVKAILNPTSKEFKELTERARELGRTTAFSASQAADAFVELGKLGLNTNQILAASADVLNLAAASQVEMAVAATATAEVLAQFSLDASESQRVVDVMSKSFTSSALDLTKFQESMKFVGATAAQMNIPLEETTAALSALASQGIHGSMAGTALRRIMLDLYDPASKAGKIIGLTANDTRSLSERLQVLQTRNLSPSKIKATFGLLATTSAGILIKGAQNVKRFDDLLKDAEGTAKRMADTMLDNVAGATKILESAQEDLALALGNSFGRDTQERIEAVTEDISTLSMIVERFSGRFEVLGSIWNSTLKWLSDFGVNRVRDFLEMWILVEKAIKKYNIAMLEAEIATMRVLNVAKKFIGMDAYGDKVIDATKKLKGMKKELEQIEKDHQDLLFGGADAVNQKVKSAKTKAVGKLLSKVPSSSDETTTPIKKATEKMKKGEFKNILQRAQKRVALEYEINGMILEAQVDGEKKEIAQAVLAFEKQNEYLLNADAASKEYREAAYDLHKKRLAEIDDKYRKIEGDKLDYDLAEEKRKRQESIEFAINGVSQLSNAFAGFSRVRTQNEVKRARAAGRSQEQIDKLRKRGFEREKQFSRVGAIMNTALGVTRAYATMDPISATVAASIIASVGLIQLATINAQKFAQGGLVKGSGNRDTVPAMLTPGELVLNRAQQKNLANSGGRSISIDNIQINVDGSGTPQETAFTIQEKLMALSEMNSELDALSV